MLLLVSLLLLLAQWLEWSSGCCCCTLLLSLREPVRFQVLPQLLFVLWLWPAAQELARLGRSCRAWDPAKFDTLTCVEGFAQPAA